MGNFRGNRPGNDGHMVSATGSVPCHPIFTALEIEWRRLLRSSAWQAEASCWGESEPALALTGRGPASADEIVTRVVWHGYRPTAEGAAVLSALLRLARQTGAARALLQALLPRIGAERVGTPIYGHRLGCTWPRPADTSADLVAECFTAIARHAGEDRGEVDRLIVGEAARRLRTARQSQRRYEVHTVALPPGEELVSGLSCARSGAEWLVAALVDAVRAGRLSTGDARLIYDTRVKGFSAREAGQHHGLAPRCVYYALGRAERAFREWAA